MCRTQLAILLLLLSLHPLQSQQGEDTAPPENRRESGPEGGRPDWVTPGTSRQTGTGDSEPEPTWVPNRPEVPERSVPDDAELHFLAREATAGDRDQRVQSVRRIEALVRDGRFTPSDPELIGLLRRVALEHVLVDRRGAPSAGYPIARYHAVRALAHMRGDEVHKILLRVLENDTDPTVLAEAMRSLADLKVFPDDEFSTTLVHMMQRVPRQQLNGQLGMAILNSVSRLDDVGPGIQSAELYRELIQLALHASDRSVRTRAYEVIEALREKGRKTNETGKDEQPGTG